MKKLKKLQINTEKLMNNEELLELKGGYDGNPNCASTTKIEACEGLYEGHGCCWTWNGMIQYGKCVRIFSGPLHCSDLN